MFDRDGYIGYVGDKSGVTYAYGLSRIEALCSVSIDDEFENDRCASLLSTLDNMMAENGDAGAELKKVSAKSKLRKYIEFKEEPFQPKEPIVEQFRECLKDISIGTRMKRQDIIELISSRYGTKASSIIPSDYCYNMTNKGIPEDHVSFFLNVGTGLYEYVGENYSLPTIEGVIAAYKADFERVDDQERYKWEAVAHYKQHWNIEAEDFAGMVQEAFRWAGEQYKRPRDGKKDGGNLLTSSMYYPYRMLVTLSTFEPETMRSLFRRLLDEQRPLSLRYEEFRDGCEECRERFQKSDPDHQKANNHYQDLRAISVYLTFEYPEKYFLYKYQMFKQFSDLLGLSSMRQTTKGEKAESALISYNKMCETIVDAVRKDPELQAMSKARLDENCYPDPEFHLLTMDIIYFGSNMTREGTIGVNSLTKQQGQTSNIGKNTILYGPPGTGKTYNTVIYAVAIIEDKPLEEIKSEPYDEVIERYNTYKSEGQIEFTTFHQSYGYEEFIEGIKPRMDQGDGEGSDLEYEICSGLFKSFCEKASQPIARETREDLGLNASPTVWKVSLNGTGNNPVRTECLENGHIRIGWDSYGPSLTDETEYKNKGRVVLNAFINRMKVGDIVLSCFSATTIDAIGVVTGDYEWHEEYGSMMRQRNVKWLVKGIQEDITELNGANMTLASVYKLNISVADVMAIVLKHSPSSTAVKSGTNNYVFIIDEINRGNISKVFGELITLIEPSKRIGKTEGMTVKLPYSGKLFGVPDNVYLIGTMNTADRSIATIDTALRRRFQFKEMQPDPSVLEGVSVEDISIKDMLERMNRKISILYDREHTIGHGYFIPLKEDASIEVLASIFENNIIPLLQEYFYDDYEKIRLVLGDTTKEDEAEQFIVARAADYDELFGTTDVGLDDTVFYQINPEAFDNIDAYRSI